MLRRTLASPQAGLVLVILLLGGVLGVFAGSHVDARTRPDGQQFPQLLHADPDRDGRELLRDHGGRRDNRHHLGWHRPLGRLHLRACGRHDGDGPAKRGADGSAAD